MFKRTLTYFLTFAFTIGLSFVSWGQSQNSAKNISDIDIKIYPNPAVDQFILDLKSDIKIKSITVNNIIGKEVIKFYASEHHIYNVSGLKKGIYIVRIFAEDDTPLKVLRLSKS